MAGVMLATCLIPLQELHGWDFRAVVRFQVVCWKATLQVMIVVSPEIDIGTT